MYKSLMVMLIVFSFSTINCQTTINGGYVYSSKWTKSGSPYNIYGDLEIPYGERLTIEPGVQVIFYGHYWINVQGSIIAKGKKDDLISFNSCNSSTKWFGIRFIYTPQSSPESLIEYCHLLNSSAILEDLPGDPDPANKRHGGAIYLRQFSKLTIANCIIENCYAAAGGGIGLRDYSSPVIKDNIIRYNVSQGPSSGWGGGISITMYSTPMIKGNIIEYNNCIGNANYAGGSGIYLDLSSDAKIINNIIRYNRVTSSKGDKNYDGAAFYIHSSSPQLVGNLIYSNSNDIENGGGFWMYRCNSKIINNTIKSNYATNGGGFFLRESNPVFHNNIIRYNEASGSGSQFYLNDTSCDPDFYNNNIQGGLAGFEGPGAGSYFSGDWVNNIDEDPDYVGGTKEFSYELQSSSPCISAGISVQGFQYPLEIDIKGNIRTFNTIDVGAYEFNSQPYQLLTPEGITMSLSSGNLIISWNAVPNTLYYRVVSSDDNINYEDDFDGTFNGNTWTTPTTKQKRFYKVVAVN